MNPSQLIALKRHFLEWSGGFEPESTFQISVYVDYSLAVPVDAEEARDMLTRWMESSDDEPFNPGSAGFR